MGRAGSVRPCSSPEAVQRVPQPRGGTCRCRYGAAVASPLLAVDTPSMLYRAFHALPKSITDDDGKPVNALLGTANLILREVERHQPRAVVLCFGPDAAAYRTELLPAYHADRPEMPELLVPQWDAARGMFTRFGWTIAEDDRYEADDALGTLARLETEAGGKTLLMTGDRDMFQCATADVTVLYVSTGGKQGGDPIGPDEVRARYGIGPELVPDFIALRGDPSDGIPGSEGRRREDGRGSAQAARLARRGARQRARRGDPAAARDAA